MLVQSHSLAETQSTFLDIGTCPLRIIHNAFRKGVSSLEFDVDQFALVIHLLSCQLNAELITRAWSILLMLWLNMP